VARNFVTINCDPSLTILIQLTSVTDRRTDGQTDRRPDDGKDELSILLSRVKTASTMRLSSTVMEIWPFEVLPGRLFLEQRSVGRRSVLNITLFSHTPIRYVRNVAREE